MAAGTRISHLSSRSAALLIFSPYGTAFQAVVFVGHLEQLCDRQSLRVKKASRSIGYPDDFHADVGEFFHNYRADIAKALDHRGALDQIDPQVFRRFNDHVDHASPCRFASTQRTSNIYRFTGNDFRYGMALVL